MPAALHGGVFSASQTFLVLRFPATLRFNPPTYAAVAEILERSCGAIRIGSLSKGARTVFWLPIPASWNIAAETAFTSGDAGQIRIQFFYLK